MNFFSNTSKLYLSKLVLAVSVNWMFVNGSRIHDTHLKCYIGDFESILLKPHGKAKELFCPWGNYLKTRNCGLLLLKGGSCRSVEQSSGIKIGKLQVACGLFNMYNSLSYDLIFPKFKLLIYQNFLPKVDIGVFLKNLRENINTSFRAGYPESQGPNFLPFLQIICPLL